VIRAALMITPQPGLSLTEEVGEVLDAVRDVLDCYDWPLVITTQTVFLRDAADQALCQKLFDAHPKPRTAVTHYTVQPPANGARLAVEAWAAGGPGVVVERFSPEATLVCYDGLRWLHTANVTTGKSGTDLHANAWESFWHNGALLAAAGMGWQNVVRAWWYLGGITEVVNGKQRYAELNRARAEAFSGLHFGNNRMLIRSPHADYPASTGIGTAGGADLSLTTLALQTDRRDVTLLPLESPLQTPAYDYAACYSPQSPKFSRAMALLTPNYVTVWISGTASIVQSEVLHAGDIAAQTDQTLDNIAALISAQNFARHGQRNAGATLRDLAKARVYVKRSADVAACRRVCEHRLGNIPAIYVRADVCRPELLVEIEGVAFASRTTCAGGS